MVIRNACLDIIDFSQVKGGPGPMVNALLTDDDDDDDDYGCTD